MMCFPPAENLHERHILDVTSVPAGITLETNAKAIDLAVAITETLQVVGLLAVEMFVLPSGEILVNELAPRPHNSGHFTIDACITSQFEQQLRAVCNLPLGDVTLVRPTAMANLLGDLWGSAQRRGAEAQREMSPKSVQSAKSADKFPDWTAVLTNPHLKLHLYGKQTARPRRKMGHLTALADSVAEAEKIVRGARERLVIE
jgi:5-(carboxyamino)imidazole ribonucleotide synthase